MESTYTVTELSQVVARAVTRALPDEVWVEGEIRDLSRSRTGHVFFTLVDPDVDQEAAAVLPVSLFASDREAVNRVLIKSGAMRMTDGVHVRIRGRVGHYAPRGTVQLRMTWIDTEYTAGRLAAARQALLRALAAEGTLGHNARLPVPALPLRIGLITSVGSAAHADFMTELERSGYGFGVAVVDARVQGSGAAGSIVAALATLAAFSPDVVALVRGGGAQTDLAAFDTEEVALAIARAAFPVFTGIGHEVDTTVADHAAARRFKTPTACAQGLVAIVREAAERLSDAQRRIGLAARRAIEVSSRRVDEARRRAVQGSRTHLGRHGRIVSRAASSFQTHVQSAPQRAVMRLLMLGRRLAARGDASLAVEAARIHGVADRLTIGAARAVSGADRRLAALDSLRRAHAPEGMLARGWSVTYGAQGQLVRTPHDVMSGEHIRTRLHGGSITSIVDDEEGRAS